MKKILLVVLFLLINNCFISAEEIKSHKVLRVIDGDTVYVDFNDNGVVDKEERVRLNGIDTFETKPGVYLDAQIRKFGLTRNEALGMGYLGKEFAKRKLLNKYVIAKPTAEVVKDKNERPLVSLYFDDGKNYEQEILKAGLAVVYTKSNLAPDLEKYRNQKKLEENIKRAGKLDLVILNTKSGKYHKIDCEYGLNSYNKELIKKPLFKYKPAGCCFLLNNVPQEAKKVNELNSDIRNFKLHFIKDHIHKKAENPIPYIKTSSIELYFIDGYKYKKPANYARTAAVQALINEINHASESIDFAVFGFSSQPELLNAILNAQKRGVKVRWVVDMTPWNFNFYSGTKYALKMIPNYKTDYLTDKALLEYYQKQGVSNYNGTLIHDKYFIIDNKIVWTGSTNISSSGTGGYNTNVSAIIKSAELAELYTKDFEKMFVNGNFHKNKSILFKKGIRLKDNSVIDVFFSPNPHIVDNGILPIINLSKQYIYIPIFYLTNQEIIDALISVRKKGVDVKIILDAHSAGTQYSKIKEIRESGIPIKVEDWGGKMHMKSLIADDKYIILGSCNFTNTGININDENLLIIENTELAVAFRKKFEEYWSIIPTKWLKEIPSAEGVNSIGSCKDGLDNDHNGLIDKDDPKCK